MDAPTSKKTKVEGEGNSKEADDVRSMSIMEEDQGDGKPAADNDMPDQDKAPTRRPHWEASFGFLTKTWFVSLSLLKSPIFLLLGLFLLFPPK